MNLKLNFSFQKISDFLKKNFFWVIYAILVFCVLYLLFFMYQNLYQPLMETKPIDPALIKNKKEVVNQNLFQKVTEKMKEKKTPLSDDSSQNVNDIFSGF